MLHEYKNNDKIFERTGFPQGWDNDRRMRQEGQEKKVISGRSITYRARCYQMSGIICIRNSQTHAKINNETSVFQDH